MNTNLNMKTQVTTTKIMCGLCLAVFALMLAGSAAHAQTFIAGNIGGTWPASGNPYIATDNCTLTNDLTIQPGVVLMIGSNLTITANGYLIQAVGTPANRIKIQPAVSSQFWNMISLIGGLVAEDPGTNLFKYCDFTGANMAISMVVYGSGVSQSMFAEIMNCTFTNCTTQAIYAESAGHPFNTSASHVYPDVRNCTFNNTSNGCLLLIHSGAGVGYASPTFYANVFRNLDGAAIRMSAAADAGSSHANVINNTFVNCRVGVSAADPWDAQVQDNVFVGATNAVVVSGSLSRAVQYNDFYANATNFTGYPGGIYGSVATINRNGTPSDILYNTFQDPLFIASNDFHLSTNSPCIDAGTPNWAFTDMCFPPSLGTSFPDLGAYGGPDACNWLDVVPLLPVQASMSISNSSIWLNWGALPRSEYQIQYRTNLTTGGPLNWLNLDNGDIVAVDKPISFIVSPDPATNNAAFFRIQSLGRTDGN